MVSHLDNAATGVSEIHQKNRPDYWERRRLIRESTFRPREKWALAVIADYAGDDSVCWQTQEILALDFGVGERQTRDCLQVLKQAEVLVSVKRGRGESDLINVIWEALQSYQQERRESAGQEIKTGGKRSSRPAEFRRSSIKHSRTPQEHTSAGGNFRDS